MSTTPSTLKYAKSDEWFDAASGKVGLSDYAQGQLSDIVFVEIIVSVGDTLSAGQAIASVESVKAASDVYAPVSGKVIAVNEALAEAPESINSDPYGAAWFIQIEGGNGSALLDAAAYDADCSARAH